MADENDVSCSGEATNDGGAAEAPPMDVIGGPGEVGVMLVLLLMGLMNYAMRDPCTC